MAYDGPDFTGLPEEIESVYRAAYPQPIQQPTYQPVARDHRLGPLRINGGALDSATLAVLQAMQNQPMPRSGAGGFVAGVAQGFAGARGRQIGQRQKQYERDEQRAADEAEERRRFRSQAGASLAKGRWDMYREGKQQEATAARGEAAAEAAEERRAAAAAAAEERQRRYFDHQERMQQLRFNSQMKLMDLKSKMPESPGKAKSLAIMVGRMAVNDPDTKEFVVVRDFYNQGTTSLKAKDSFGDLMAMRALAKVSDKLTGVREGEYDTFEKAAGLLMRYGMLGPKMFGRGTLTQTGRDAVQRELQSIYEDKKRSHLAANEHWRNAGSALDVDVSPFLRDLSGAGADSAGTKAFDWDKP